MTQIETVLVAPVPQERISELTQIVDVPVPQTEDLIKYQPLTPVSQTVDQPGDQACREYADSLHRPRRLCARVDATTGPSSSDGAENGGSHAGAVRRQSSGCACDHASMPVPQVAAQDTLLSERIHEQVVDHPDDQACRFSQILYIGKVADVPVVVQRQIPQIRDPRRGRMSHAFRRRPAMNRGLS